MSERARLGVRREWTHQLTRKKLEGNVVAQEVMVRGRLIGSVRAQKVMLQSTAHVEGNLVHKSLAVEHGTHFEGESRPSENPLTSSREVPGVEPQLNHDGHSETVERRERGNGFIKFLPELLSA